VIARNRSLGALDHQHRDLHSIKLSYLTEDRVASTITRPSRSTGLKPLWASPGNPYGLPTVPVF
jgi:hypothetical protein